MSLGNPVVNTVGALTAPSSAVTLTLGTALSTLIRETGLYTAIPIPSTRSVFISHGIEAMRHVLNGAHYRIGILAPQAAQTVAPTGTRASSVLTITTNPNDGDRIQLGAQPDGTFSEYIYFKTTLNTTTFTAAQVLIGANIAATLNNLDALIQGTGTNGTEYYDADQMTRNGFYSSTYWHTKHLVERSAINTGAGTITFRSTIAGVIGNGFNSKVDVGGARMAFSNTPLMAGGVAGTGTAPAAGEYDYAYQHYRSGDGALSGRSALASITSADNTNINQTNFVDASTRYGATHFRQLRTATGGVDLWRVQDTTIATSEPYVDSLNTGTESDIGTLVGVGAIPYEETIYRLYAAGPPTVGRYAAVYKGSVWTGGALRAADITRGTVTIVDESYTATFSTTLAMKEKCIGRTLQVSGDVDEYLIVDVDEAAGTVKLGLPYSGTATAANYTVSDKRNPFSLYYSEPLLPNNFPSGNEIGDITSLDQSGISGLKAAWDSLIAWTKTGVWRIYGDHESGFRLQNIGEGMGCFSGGSVVDVEGTLFWLGRDGIYMWTGSGDPQSISEPPSPAGTFPRGIQRTLDRINFDEAEMIVSVYNPSTKCIIWAVPLDGETKNNYGIVYDTQSGAFTMDHLPSITAMTAVPGVSGSHVTIGGDAYGNIFQLEIGNCDGCFGVEPVQTFSSHSLGTNTTTFTGSPGMPTSNNGLSGIPVLHISTSGVIQRNKIASNTASTITVTNPWDTAPANGIFVLGGILLDVKTAKYDFGHPLAYKWLDRTVVSFDPQASEGQIYVAAGVDNNEPALFNNRKLGTTDWGDLTDTDGEKEFPNRTDRGRRLVQRFISISPGMEVVLMSFSSYIGTNVPLGGGGQ